MIKRYLLVFAGITSLSVGFLGVFLPILPTTPFLLISAACFLRSSQSLYHWLIHHRVFGRYIACYLRFRAVSIRSKVISIGLLWSVILSTVIFFTTLVWIRILLLCVAVGVTIHLATMRTLTKEMIDQLTFDD